MLSFAAGVRNVSAIKNVLEVLPPKEDMTTNIRNKDKDLCKNLCALNAEP